MNPEIRLANFARKFFTTKVQFLQRIMPCTNGDFVTSNAVSSDKMLALVRTARGLGSGARVGSIGRLFWPDFQVLDEQLPIMCSHFPVVLP